MSAWTALSPGTEPWSAPPGLGRTAEKQSPARATAGGITPRKGAGGVVAIGPPNVAVGPGGSLFTGGDERRHVPDGSATGVTYEELAEMLGGLPWGENGVPKSLATVLAAPRSRQRLVAGEPPGRPDVDSGRDRRDGGDAGGDLWPGADHFCI
mgnify:CR=1 FL=1